MNRGANLVRVYAFLGARIETGLTNGYYTINPGSDRTFLAVSSTQIYVSGSGIYAVRSNNLSDLVSIPTARTNLGLSRVAASGVFSDLSAIPVASSTSQGIVQVDGISITVNNGVISASGAGSSGYILPTASDTVLGGVKLDNTSIVATNGVISIASSFTCPPKYSLPRTVITGSTIVLNPSDYVVLIKKTTGSATTIMFESLPLINTVHIIKDSKGDCATNPITVIPDSGTIDSAASIVMNQNGSSYTFIYTGVEWNLI